MLQENDWCWSFYNRVFCLCYLCISQWAACTKLNFTTTCPCKTCFTLTLAIGTTCCVTCDNPNSAVQLECQMYSDVQSSPFYEQPCWMLLKSPQPSWPHCLSKNVLAGILLLLCWLCTWFIFFKFLYWANLLKFSERS